MSEHPIIGDEPPDDATLAGEYVLGLLPGHERRAAERRVASDAAFAALVDSWASRLQPLADAVPAVEPPPHAWSAIAAATSGGRAQATQTTGFWQSLPFWRWATAVASAAAVAGFLVVVSLVDELRREPLLASLQSAGSGPIFLARIDPASGRLVIHPVALQHPPATVPELWLIPDDGRPRSLGVIADAAPSQIDVPQPLVPHMRTDATLAVSLEPQGGSPTGQPTGPVIATGKLQKI